MNTPHVSGGQMPKKRDLLRFVRNDNDLQRVAKDDVAMYIFLTLAQMYADDINEVCQKYNLSMGLLKHQYKKLDKAMKEYDQEFRIVIQAGEEWNFLDGYLSIQDPVTTFVDEYGEDFAKLFKGLHELVANYVENNVENDTKDIEERVEELTNG
ncbi:MAG: hypothetical protein II604_08805 [Bacteroidales bacterium]|nr:hypothetical protein [Bacteroidales bacterium]